jgi:hypothetical protein
MSELSYIAPAVNVFFFTTTTTTTTIIIIGSTALRGPWPSSEASASYCFFRFRDKGLFPGGVVSPTPNTRLSRRAYIFCQGCLPQLFSPNFKASGSRFLPLHDLAV